MNTWNIVEAAERVDELFQRAIDGQPQRIEVPGGGAVVVVSAADYVRLAQHDHIDLD